MNLTTLFEKLREHALEFNRITQDEESDKKKRGIALQASSTNGNSEVSDKIQRTLKAKTSTF